MFSFYPKFKINDIVYFEEGDKIYKGQVKGYDFVYRPIQKYEKIYYVVDCGFNIYIKIEDVLFSEEYEIGDKKRKEIK